MPELNQPSISPTQLLARGVGLMAGALIAVSGNRYAGLFAGVALAAACLHWADAIFFLVYFPPLFAFAFMAYFFSRTLAPGIEPLITRVARKEHPDLTIAMAQFTRTLTWAWSLCFALLFLAALSLALVLPLDSWSRWVHGLGYVVPATLFLGEYVYRHRRFPERTHGSLRVLILNIIAVVREAAVTPGVHSPQNRDKT